MHYAPGAWLPPVDVVVSPSSVVAFACIPPTKRRRLREVPKAKRIWGQQGPTRLLECHSWLREARSLAVARTDLR